MSGTVQETGFDKAPSHYAGEREVIDLIRDAMTDEGFADFCLGNVIKYKKRAGKKGSALDTQKDLDKAHWYAEMQVHVLSQMYVSLGSRHVFQDPRSERDDFKPYVRQGPAPVRHTFLDFT